MTLNARHEAMPENVLAQQSLLHSVQLSAHEDTTAQRLVHPKVRRIKTLPGREDSGHCGGAKSSRGRF